MRNYLTLPISLVWIGLALLVSIPELAAQQETKTPAQAVAPPFDDNPGPNDESTIEVESESSNEEEASTPEASKPTAQDFYEQAQGEADSGNLDDAIAYSDLAIEMDPKNVKFLLGRAGIFGDARQFSKLFEDVSAILAIDPNNLDARLLRAKSFELQGQNDKSLTELNEAIERNPSSVNAFEARRDFYARRSERDLALADSDRIIQLQGDGQNGFLSRAEVNFHFGDYDEAIKYASLGTKFRSTKLAGFAYARNLAREKVRI